MARGLDAGKYFWRSGREKCFSLDIPFNRTSGGNCWQWNRQELVRIFLNWEAIPAGVADD